MNYIKITHNDIANGTGVRCVLWVAGCENHCDECQNPDTWDKNAGQPFDANAMMSILKDMEHAYKAGLTLSGGDPLYPDNIESVYAIVHYCKIFYPTKTIWLYTGYSWEDIKDLPVMKYVDVLVDGKYKKELYNIGLKWKGSSNQRVIDVQKSLSTESIVLYDE